MSTQLKDAKSEQADLDDLYYCYRILLNREPDEDGWTYWVKRLEAEPFSISKLVANFYNQHEYIIRLRSKGIRLIVDLACFPKDITG